MISPDITISSVTKHSLPLIFEPFLPLATVKSCYTCPPYLTLTPDPKYSEINDEKSLTLPVLEIDRPEKYGPNPEPIGLFPGGTPISVYPFPFGIMEYGRASLYLLIIYSRESLASASSALTFSKLRVASETILIYRLYLTIAASRFSLASITFVLA